MFDADTVILWGAGDRLVPVRLAALRDIFTRALASPPLGVPAKPRKVVRGLRSALPVRDAAEIAIARAAPGQAKRLGDAARAKRGARGRRGRLSLADRLEKQGKLERQHVVAWNELAVFLEMWENGLGLAMNYDNMQKIDVSVYSREFAYADPVRVVYQQSFLPWQDSLRAAPIKIGRRCFGEASEMVICAIGGMSLRELERKFKIRNGDACLILCAALHRWRVCGFDLGV